MVVNHWRESAYIKFVLINNYVTVLILEENISDIIPISLFIGKHISDIIPILLYCVQSHSAKLNDQCYAWSLAPSVQVKLYGSGFL